MKKVENKKKKLASTHYRIEYRTITPSHKKNVNLVNTQLRANKGSIGR